MKKKRRQRNPPNKRLVAALTPLVVIGIPLIVILVTQFRYLDRYQSTMEQVLEQAGARAAEDLARRAEAELGRGVSRALELVDVQALLSGDLERLEAGLERGDLPAWMTGRFVVGLPATGAAADGGTADDRTVLFYRLGAYQRTHRGGRGAPTNATPGFFDEPLLRPAIEGLVRQYADRGAVLGHGHLTVDARRHAAVFRLLYDDGSGTDLAGFYGFALDLADLADDPLSGLLASLRRRGASLATEVPLEIMLFDDLGSEIYRSGPALSTGYEHELAFPVLALRDPGDRGPRPPATRWVVRAGYPGTSAAALARARVDQQRQFLVLGAIIVAVGILLSGRALFREVRLAEMKAEFVSSISHDLKTPVASIHVLAEMLESGRTTELEKVKSYGHIIRDEARKLGQLIEGFLEFNKIETGNRMYQVEEIDLRDVVKEAVASFVPQLERDEFRTRLRLPASPVTFVGNREALTQSVENLLSNAIKYSREDRFLEVSLEVEEGNAVVEVEDRGPGIPPAERGRIFERFYRVRRDPTTEATGTGLGLSIVQHTVRAHGGRILVDDAPDHGSVFRIELPLGLRPETGEQADDAITDDATAADGTAADATADEGRPEPSPQEMTS